MEPHQQVPLPVSDCSDLAHQSADTSDQLRSLISSVDSLRTEMSELRRENASPKTRVQDVLQNSGALFYLFSDLPQEVQRMIWVFALIAPQIHMMSKTGCSKSQVNSIMMTCRTAREEFLKLQLPYYRFNPQYEHGGEADYDPMLFKNYTNLENDILWVESEGTRPLLPVGIEFTCSKCLAANPTAGGFQRFLRRIPDCEHQYKVRGVAIPQAAWIWVKDSMVDFDDIYPGSISTIWACNNASEVFLVSNRKEFFKRTSDNRHAVFRPPKLALEEYERSQGYLELTRQDEISYIASMLNYKRGMTAIRKYFVEEFGVTQDEVTEGLGPDFDSVEDWIVPKVTLVKALSPNNK